MSFTAEVGLCAALAALACSLSGVFLVLRRQAMLADAISHSILPGLIAGYWIATGPNLLLGTLFATLSALVTVWAVDVLRKTGLVREDAAIGLVFPTMFAIGVWIVSRSFENVHLDADAVLYGEIALAPLERLRFGDMDLGPRAAWSLGTLALLNLAFLAVFFPRLKASTFDPDFSRVAGLGAGVLSGALMAVVAATTVGAFTAVGAILAVALVVVPAAAAWLLARSVLQMILWACAIGVAGALIGHRVAVVTDLSISGLIAMSHGGLFMIALAFAPKRGLIVKQIEARDRRRRFAALTLVAHLLTHEGTLREPIENRYGHLIDELGWTTARANFAVGAAKSRGWIKRSGADLALTVEGRRQAEDLREIYPPIGVGSA